MVIFEQWETEDTERDVINKIADGLSRLGFSPRTYGVLKELESLGQQYCSLTDIKPKKLIVRVVRGPDRRKFVIPQLSSDLDLVMCLERVCKDRALSEDEEEVLAAAKARLRSNGTGFGNRAGKDRRVNYA